MPKTAPVLVQEPPDQVEAAVVESTYREPSASVVALVDARPTPRVTIAPTHDRMLLLGYDAHPSIAVVAQSFERLAGIRIDVKRAAARRTRLYETLTLVELADGSHRKVELPQGAELSSYRWAPDGQHVALTRWVDDGVELWVLDVAAATSRRVGTVRLNTVFGASVDWMPGSQSLLVQLVPPDHGPPPLRPTVPSGPTTLDTTGTKATNRTYQDLLSNRVDEAVFSHYATSRLAIVSLSGAVTELGGDDLYTSATPSPDGQYVLVERVRTPFSYAVPYYRFARTIEVRDLKAKVVRVVAEQDVADGVPIGGVRQGARGVHWQPTADATLAWREALDGGDPDTETAHRDRLMTHAAPFADTPEERLRTVQRLSNVAWTSRPDELLVTEYDRDRRWVTTHLYGRKVSGPASDPAGGSRVLFDRSVRDAYGDPGRPVYSVGLTGHASVTVDEGKIYLSGNGATPDGDRPFLTRYDLATGATEELMRASGEEHVVFAGFGSSSHDRWLVRRESAEAPPDYYLEGAGGSKRMTELPHPHPQLSGIEKRVLKYTRKDGVELSGTLYLPPDYDPETATERLPLVVWAYPVEYNDPATAGQVRAAPHRFTRLRATSPLMLLTQGYAVLSNAAMPVVGDPETMNDTFIEQIVWDAEAAIDACVAEGVADRDRIGVAGHSYGAFMTANLLAHSDLFRAGIARSGAYNRSLTPFGFQSERRTLWEAVDTYVAVSPLFSADTLDEPILLLHGEVDSNSGTYPLQSKRLFHALKGVGGTARLVLLPEESHGYAARESVLHVLAESFEWLDKYVKNAPPRSTKKVPRPG
ncbi:MAG: S9 family peptidase [Nannocystaceae bacterium]|nr:S9 family peptidase [Nannocystaceae bacterium]